MVLRGLVCGAVVLFLLTDDNVAVNSLLMGQESGTNVK